MIGIMTSPDDGRFIDANGISLYLEEHGDGVPVLLIHGWPDSARLWRHQVPVLAAAGFRVITPDMRGFGRSGRPADVAAYRLRTLVADVNAILDQLAIDQAHVVGHDWGAAAAWLSTMLCPDRVRSLTAISVPHPRAPGASSRWPAPSCSSSSPTSLRPPSPPTTGPGCARSAAATGTSIRRSPTCPDPEP